MTSGNLPRCTLVLGGARSGKSAYAESLLAGCPAPWIYLATAEALDEEMRVRVRLHRERRSGDWLTIDCPRNLTSELQRAPAAGRPVLVDCLTLWLSNLMLAGEDAGAASSDLIAALSIRTAPCILVSNEVGLGIVPDNALARAFRDEAGRLNQAVASVADRVVLIAAGLPLQLKGQLRG